MFYTIQNVMPMNDYKLLVTFANGEQKQYDVKPLCQEREMFNVLFSVIGLFEQVRVDAGGYGISWNEELDISCNELYYNGVTL